MVAQRRVLRQRLGGEGVERGAGEVAFVEQQPKRILVDQAAARADNEVPPGSSLAFELLREVNAIANSAAAVRRKAGVPCWICSPTGAAVVVGGLRSGTAAVSPFMRIKPACAGPDEKSALRIGSADKSIHNLECLHRDVLHIDSDRDRGHSACQVRPSPRR